MKIVFKSVELIVELIWVIKDVLILNMTKVTLTISKSLSNIYYISLLLSEGDHFYLRKT